ncbi:polysaccharide deacetylase family protein [Bacillus infantis]|uniref:Polysaccharide deacetylase family protein n=1 Tax=Bacillus infantis TaxID=324767 RepID=A0A5D4RGG3_9BACI|nr:polysaccharide deacetylase family protein [Bacillus infantis]TYS49930.1 polysaccharide deacetylase family protein [Bacillus infantis]
MMYKKTAALALSAMLLSACGAVGEAGEDKGEETKNAVETAEEQASSDAEEAVESGEASGTDIEETGSQEEQPAETEDKEPLYRINENNWTIEPLADANKKVVLLTIDDAPDKHAVEMAKTLKRLGVNAIFFVNGHFLDTPEEEEKLKEIHSLGFPIGNHTYSHSNLKEISPAQQKEEVLKLNKRVEEIIGEKPRFFRAPFGINTDASREAAAAEGMELMNWTYGYDWEKDYQNKEALTDIMVNSPYLTDGANLLMHDRDWTNAALEGIVKGLQAKGYEIVDPDRIQTAL